MRPPSALQQPSNVCQIFHDFPVHRLLLTPNLELKCRASGPVSAEDCLGETKKEHTGKGMVEVKQESVYLDWWVDQYTVGQADIRASVAASVRGDNTAMLQQEHRPRQGFW